MEKGAAYNYMMEKTAFNAQMLGQVADMAAGASKAGAVIAGITLSAGVLQGIYRQIQNDIRRKAIVEDLANYDPILKNVDKAKIKEWYATMMYYAPVMSADKQTAREVLTGFSRFDKVDLKTLKELADTELALAKGRSESILSKLLPQPKF